MHQPPPHATYKKVVVNTFVIDSHVKERIKLWDEFVNRGFTRSSLLSSPDEEETTKNDEGIITNKRQEASDCVLTYDNNNGGGGGGVSVGPLRVSLKLDPSRLPSFCASAGYNPSSNSNNNPPIVSLTSKLLELCEYEKERRSKISSSVSSSSSPTELFDVPSTISRAIKCLQYAHLSRLIHGRICTDAFFISAFENPWIPTLCLGELPLGPQFFANLGQELGKTTSSSTNSTNNNSTSAATNHHQKQAINQPQATSWWKVLAPEVLRKEAYTSAADVWGLGVLTIQLCMASMGCDSSIWTNLETEKDLMDVNLLSPVFRKGNNTSGNQPPQGMMMIPPPAISFASMCLKSNPLQRPTLAGLLNHPWLKMNSSSNKNVKSDDDSKEKEKESTSPVPQTAETIPNRTNNNNNNSSSSKSAFKADLDPKKVSEVLAALERAKQARAANVVAVATSSTTMKQKKNDVQESSGEDDEEEDEEEESSNSSTTSQEEKDDELDASSSSEDVKEDDDEESEGSSSSEDDEE